MEDCKKKTSIENDKNVVFTKVVKAGHRIYYLDVKRTVKNELYLSITESKRVVNEAGDHDKVVFEKHKIFLYPEDFRHFEQGLEEALDFVRLNQGEKEPRREMEKEEEETENNQ